MKTKVTDFLDIKNITYRPLPHENEAKTVELAVQERGVPIHEMIKCILLKDKKKKFVLVCLTGEAKLNTQEVRNYLDDYKRLSFASREELVEILGYEIGSIPPIALKTDVPVVLDEKIRLNDKVNISSGNPMLGIELRLDELLNCINNPIFGRVSQ